MAQAKITITYDKDTTVDVQNRLQNNPQTSKMQLAALENSLNRVNTGVSNATVSTTVDDGNAVSATGTITLTGANTANDTILINGVTFTAVASGATGNQWNVTAGASGQAGAIVTAINAAASLAGYVTASNVSGVVTITSSVAGLIGNAVTIAKGTDAGSVMTVSGARLTGGLAPTNALTQTYKFGM